MKKTKATPKPKRPTQQVFPPGWDQQRVKKVIADYESQTEEEQVAEHQAAYKASDQTMMGVPTALVPEIRKLIARRRGA